MSLITLLYLRPKSWWLTIFQGWPIHLPTIIVFQGYHHLMLQLISVPVVTSLLLLLVPIPISLLILVFVAVKLFPSIILKPLAILSSPFLFNPKSCLPPFIFRLQSCLPLFCLPSAFLQISPLIRYSLHLLVVDQLSVILVIHFLKFSPIMENFRIDFTKVR